MQAMRKYKFVFGRNLYDTDETNSILEIRLTLHCPIFEETKSSYLRLFLSILFTESQILQFPPPALP